MVKNSVLQRLLFLSAMVCFAAILVIDLLDFVYCLRNLGPNFTGYPIKDISFLWDFVNCSCCSACVPEKQGIEKYPKNAAVPLFLP